jgi:predicted O-methyltransferase YrrM
MNFDRRINLVIEQYHQRMEDEKFYWENLSMEEMMKREDEWLLAVGYNTGIFINNLAKSAKSKTILELGTSYGYSTIFLAEAARVNGGQVISLEIHPEKIDYARQKIKDAGLSDFVDFRLGDALQLIENSEENYDFVLLDIWKRYYLPSFELFYPKLNKGAWVIADNMLYPPEFKPEATAYRNRIRETNSFDSVLLPLGSGIETSLLL